MLRSMLKATLHLNAQAGALNPVRVNGALNVVVRFAVVVLISILISHVHAEPV